MRNLILIFLSFIFIFSCSSNNQSKNLNNESAQLAHSKLININNNLLYEEYKSLIIKYGKNSEYPDISK